MKGDWLKLQILFAVIGATFPSGVPNGDGSIVETEGGLCSSINEDPTKGFAITCINKTKHEVNCDGVFPGTIAQYTCDKYFTPTTSEKVTRRCENGNWTELNPKFECEARCGISKADKSSIGGRWPWIVAIYENYSKSKLELLCGGSLISPEAVITAAHCVVRGDNFQIKPSNKLRLVFGKYNQSYGNPGEQERTIGRVFVHPDYRPFTISNDIAIIKLAKPVKISETVRPVCLPKAGDEIEVGNMGTAVGWVRDGENSFSELFQQANLPVVSSQQCIDSHPMFAHLVKPGTFCAGHRNRTSACNDDSGEPLVFRDKRSSKWLLHGIVSARVASADGPGCNPKYYAVFTDVDYYRKWISFVLASNFSFK